jgi:hypothetical protein
MTTNNADLRELTMDELGIVSGGNPALAVALGFFGFDLGFLMGGDAVDGFVATMVNKAKDKL